MGEFAHGRVCFLRGLHVEGLEASQAHYLRGRFLRGERPHRAINFQGALLWGDKGSEARGHADLTG